MRASHRPVCPYCEELAALAISSDGYFYRCRPCDAVIPCKSGTKKPIGTMANAELRKARVILRHSRFDPLWQRAPECGVYDPENIRAIKMIQNAARKRVLEWARLAA